MTIDQPIKRMRVGFASRLLALLPRIVFSLTAFAAIYALVDIRETIKILLHADIWLIVLSLGLFLLCTPLLAWRWQIILSSMGINVPLPGLVHILYIATFFGMALPSANGNDLVRGVMLKRPHIALGDVVGSILADRLYGILSMALLALPGAIVFLANGHASWIIWLVAYVSAALILIAAGLIVFLPKLARRFGTPRTAANGLLARITGAAFNAAKSFGPATSLTCLMLSLATQTIMVISVMFAGLAIQSTEPAAVYFAFVPVVWLLTMIPITISGLGVREAGFAVLFGTIGASYAHGMAIGAIASAVSIMAGTLGGMSLLIKTKREEPGTAAPTR